MKYIDLKLLLYVLSFTFYQWCLTASTLGERSKTSVPSFTSSLYHVSLLIGDKTGQSQKKKDGLDD